MADSSMWLGRWLAGGLSFVLLAGVPLRADDEAADLRAARELFERNLDAIRRRDREAYLACYAHGKHLARGGPSGFVTGYDDAALPDEWRGRPQLSKPMDIRQLRAALDALKAQARPQG